MKTIVRNETIHIDAQDFEKTQVVHKEATIHLGEPLLVTLDANPTTGYMWELVSISDMRVVQPVEHHYHPDLPITAGSGGTDLWLFRGIRVGKAEIHLAYDRSWEKTEPIRKVIVKVTVQ